MAEPYSPRIAIERETEGWRPASARAFGTAIGEGLEALGAAGERVLQAERRREREAAGAAAGAGFARLSGDLAIRLNELREGAEPGAAGHAEVAANEIDARIRAFLDGTRSEDGRTAGRIADERVRARFTEAAAELRARLISGEDGWARGRRAAHLTDNVREAGRLWDNQLQTQPDSAGFEAALAAAETTLDAMEVPPALREPLLREWQAGRARAYLRGKTERDPAAARQIIESGALNSYLESDDLARLTDQAQSEVAQLEIQARQAQAAARAEVNSRVEMMQRRLGDHDPSITDEDLEALQREALAAGLGTDVYDLAKARIMHRADREYRNANPIEISAAIRALDTRIAQAGDRASPDDVIRRDHLRSLLGRRTQEVQNDPLAAYARAGGRVAALNLADPASIRSRVVAARAAQRQTGFLQVLQPAEAALLREQAAAGGAGRLQAIGQLAAIGAFDPEAATDAARQVAPNDPTFRHAMRVRPETRELVVAGEAARRSLPSQVTLPDGTRQSLNTVTQNWFAAHAAPSLLRSPAEFVNDVLETSRNIYAELQRRRQSGSTPDEDFDGALFNRAVNLALGRNGGRGGLGAWRYGPRVNGEVPGVLLPSTMGQDEFDRRMAQLAQADERRASNGVPAASDGSPLTSQQIRARFIPVAVADGVYEFQANGRVLMTNRGQRFRVDVRRLPPGDYLPRAGEPDESPIIRIMPRRERTLGGE